MSHDFKLSIYFHSDWHIGSGGSRHGEADRLVIRDHEGLPFVPAKTLFGIWRDACERVAFALDHATPVPCQTWGDWIPVIFGSQPAIGGDPAIPPRAAALALDSVRLPDPARSALLHPDHACFRDAMTFLKPGVAISPETGQTISKFFRFDEMVRGGIILEGSFSLRIVGSGLAAARALLWAGARIVEHAGGKRRRGPGRCSMQLDGNFNQDECLAILAIDPPDPPPVETTGYPPLAATASSAGGAWEAVPLLLRLTQPAAIAKRTLGNVVESHDHVPGTHLLAPILRELARGGLVINWNDVAYGNIQVAPATPAIGEKRGLPIPLCIAYDKVGTDAVNLLCERVHARQMKSRRSGYIDPPDADATLLPRHHEPVLVNRTHNSIDDALQHPTETIGGVYTYEALPAGTLLRTELRIRRTIADAWGASLASWHELLGTAGEPRPLCLGSAKKDDYGNASMWRCGDAEKIGVGTPGKIVDCIVVWLTSDLLLRDERLRPTADLTVFRMCIAESLNTTVTDERDVSAETGVATRHARSESWNVTWNRPRPSAIGFAAGSCFMLRLTPPVDESVVLALEAAGLGERRAEGFGRLRINDRWLFQPLLGRSAQTGVGGQADTPGTALKIDNAFTRLLEQQVWRQWIDDAARLAASHNLHKAQLGWTHEHPSNSQLGALRQQMLVGGTELAVQLLDRFKALDKDNPRKKQWTNSQEPMRCLLKEQSTIWNLLEEEIPKPPSLTREHTAALESTLWETAVETLLGECARALTRQRASKLESDTQGANANG